MRRHFLLLGLLSSSFVVTMASEKPAVFLSTPKSPAKGGGQPLLPPPLGEAVVVPVVGAPAGGYSGAAIADAAPPSSAVVPTTRLGPCLCGRSRPLPEILAGDPVPSTCCLACASCGGTGEHDGIGMCVDRRVLTVDNVVTVDPVPLPGPGTLRTDGAGPAGPASSEGERGGAGPAGLAAAAPSEGEDGFGPGGPPSSEGERGGRRGGATASDALATVDAGFLSTPKSPAAGNRVLGAAPGKHDPECADGETGEVELCTSGCGRPRARPDGEGRRVFKTCCRACAKGTGKHDPECADGETGKAKKLCRFDCGESCADPDGRGRPFDTCCAACAK